VTHLATLAACWRSIGLRAATVEWDMDRPARLEGSLAARLRSALGPALAAGGARSATLGAIPGHSRPPALWFGGWDCPERPARTFQAELRCVGAVEPEWPALRTALARLRLPGPAAAVRCRVGWHGGPPVREAFGPPLFANGPPAVAGDACLVEALSPLHLTDAGEMVTGPPPFAVLVRSAGERLRQLCQHWGEGAESLPPVVGAAVREAREARPSWARTAPPVEVVRLSSSTGHAQRIRGLRGTFAYEEVSPLALTVLALGSQVGVGKETAFGCGQIRVSVAEVR
jgi:CRISPR-associated endoribonuclease Cas6